MSVAKHTAVNSILLLTKLRRDMQYFSPHREVQIGDTMFDTLVTFEIRYQFFSLTSGVLVLISDILFFVS